MRGSARLKGQRKKGLLMWNSTVVVGNMGKRKKQIFLSHCSRSYCEGRERNITCWEVLSQRRHDVGCFQGSAPNKS